MQLKTNTNINFLIGQLTQRISEIMAQAGLPGLSFALIRDAQVLWAEGFGVTNTQTPTPVTTETIFEACSLSKPPFAYAVLKLHEKGLLDFDAPLNTYMPDMGIEADPRLDLITTRNILSHSCGLPNWRPKGESLKIRLSPGERFSYSGEGYMLLQRVIEHLTQQTGEAFMQSRLLKPLGMEQSSYIWNGERELPLALGHDKENKPVDKSLNNTMWSSSSLHCTPTEFARFMCAMMQRSTGDEYYLSNKTLDLMLTPHIAVNDSAPWHADWPKATITLNPRVAWGLGWGLQQDGQHNSFWQWGDNFCYTAFAVGFRKEGIGVVIMTNSNKGYDVFEPLSLEALGGDYPSVQWLRSL